MFYKIISSMELCKRVEYIINSDFYWYNSRSCGKASLLLFGEEIKKADCDWQSITISYNLLQLLIVTQLCTDLLLS